MVERPDVVVSGGASGVAGRRPGAEAGTVAGAGNAALTAGELESLRRSVNRGAPFGGEAWVASTVRTHGLESTVRHRGRPAKPATEPSGGG